VFSELFQPAGFQLQSITPEVVHAARQILVIGS
jgi:hypothetical protein